MKEREIFIEALQRKDAIVREAYLREACGDDDQLRRSVEELLADQASDNSYFLDRPVGGGAPVDFVTIALPIGTQIGPYKLREQIGEGGMGVVYVAEQTEPVKRKVALKIIKPGMDTRQVIARFEAERQALAMMDHPNIARVFDGGTTESGQPYFVMELVQGIPIIEYCDQQQLGTRERLEMFQQVCGAVHHAHQKGVIHRDLKPSNVLVPRIDGAAVPKVIDFGVAKAVNQKLSEQTVYTQFSQLIGTPLYMSPEQAELGVVDIDTRSDVYSLGVMLCELLTGRTPFDSDTLKQAGFDEMRRMIREDERPRPSALVSTLEAHALSTTAERRGCDGRQLGESLRGELDWLVMMALEKDRNRRYESASALAADVVRHLNGEEVTACPPTALYRLSKFARRHRGWLSATGLVVVMLAVGLAATSWQAIRATRAEELANERLIQILRSVSILAETLEDQESYKDAEQFHRESIRIIESDLPTRTEERFAITERLAWNLDHQLRYHDAENIWRELVKSYTEFYGPRHKRTLDVMSYLALELGNQWKFAEAENVLRQLLKIHAEELGADHKETQADRNLIAIAQEKQRLSPTEVLLSQGTLMARAGKWELAKTALKGSVRSAPQNTEAWYALAVSQLQTKDLTAYRQHCQDLLANQDLQDPTIAAAIVDCFLLHPDATSDWEPILKTAERLSLSGEDADGIRLAAAQARSGNGDAVLTTLRPKDNTGTLAHRAAAWRSMGYQLEGKLLQARKELAAADGLFKEFEKKLPRAEKLADQFILDSFRQTLRDASQNSQR